MGTFWSVEMQPEGSEFCQRSRPSKYRAPSWSWASVDGEISYDQSCASDKHTLLLGVYHAGVTLLTDDDTGQVVDGHLSVCGILRRVPQRSDGFYLNEERLDENLVSSLQLLFDCESPANHGEQQRKQNTRPPLCREHEKTSSKPSGVK
jgi:hypothetical protein